jgi:GNAT superfamily N-acetyltransferase
MLTFSTQKSDLNIDFIYGFLSQSYWANKRTKEDVKQSIEHSYCFGVFLDEQQVGFARVISDTVAFAYLLDVFIDPQHQAKGYGQFLMQSVLDFEPLKNVNKWFLITKDAQKLYEKFGFERIRLPEKYMMKS